MVHPVPAPPSINIDEISSDNDGGSNQNLILFIRGKAISGAPNISGRSQLPKPPINIGITRKKIIINAWAVTIVLYVLSIFRNKPGCLSSIRISKLIEAPTIPDHMAIIKYNVPISL